MTTCLLSCIVPFKDVSVLRENLFGCLSKFTAESEIILVHDAPIRLSESEIKSLEYLDAEIRYVYGDFRSAAKARNKGLEIATGEWILFWDSDDYGYPDEVINGIMKSNSQQVLICGFNLNLGARENFKVVSTGEINQKQLVSTPGIWRFIFRRGVVAGKFFPDISLGEDILFLIDCGVFDKEILLLDEIIYEYRLSELQSTRNMNLSEELDKFLEKYSILLLTRQPNSIVAYGLYIRQTLAYLVRTRGKALMKCLRNIYGLYFGLNKSARRSFREAIPVATLRRGIIA